MEYFENNFTVEYSDEIVMWRFLRNRRLILRLHTIFRALILGASRGHLSDSVIFLFVTVCYEFFLSAAMFYLHLGHVTRPNSGDYHELGENIADEYNKLYQRIIGKVATLQRLCR